MNQVVMQEDMGIDGQDDLIQDGVYEDAMLDQEDFDGEEGDGGSPSGQQRFSQNDGAASYFEGAGENASIIKGYNHGGESFQNMSQQ